MQASAENLVSDPSWRSGFHVIAPRPLGKKVFEGFLLPPSPSETAQWELAQWASRFTLSESPPEAQPDEGIRYRDSAKQIEFRGKGLLLAIDSVVEWQGRARGPEEDWPHLLVEQDFKDRCPPLSEISAIPFQIDTCLIRAERSEPEGYSPGLHAAQFLLYFTIENCSPESSGRGDFLWLGVPIYDDRGPVEGHVFPGDIALGKVIFMPPRKVYTLEPTTQGEWILFKADLLPLAQQALEAAWNLGKLTDSKNHSDYRISGMNLGWEMPGNHRVEMRVRNLSIQVISSSTPTEN